VTPAARKPELRPVAAGVLHPLNACSWCGTDAALLRQVIWKVTEAPAVRCDDPVPCARRHRELDFQRRFGRA